MRPDLDDFEDLNTEELPQSRAMSWVVLGVAVVGFAALAYYAYQSGTQSIDNGDMIVVEAESGPIKEVPADPGGETFPHKDKTIYNALSPYRTDPPRRVEKLLPETEEPVIPEPAVQERTTNAPAPTNKEAATTYVNKDIGNGSGEPEEVKEEPAPAKTEVKEEPKPVEKVEPKKEEPKPVAKEEPKVEPKPAPKPAATGAARVQLGAFTSEAEAEQHWTKISAKHSDVLSGSHNVERAEVNGKTWYRLRASVDDAKAACATLSGRNQACMPVK